MTAVEWLYERLERMIPRNELYNGDKIRYFEQAIEMEKQQIIDSYNIGYNDAECNHINDGEQYYSQTYNHD